MIRFLELGILAQQVVSQRRDPAHLPHAPESAGRVADVCSLLQGLGVPVEQRGEPVGNGRVDDGAEVDVETHRLTSSLRTLLPNKLSGHKATVLRLPFRNCPPTWLTPSLMFASAAVNV